MINWEFQLFTEDKIPERILTNVHKAQLARSENIIGSGEIIFTGWDIYEYLAPEKMIGISRNFPKGYKSLIGNTYWIIVRRSKIRRNGKKYTSVQVEDLLTLLDRRIIAYSPGTAQATKTTNSDDMMKAVFYENYQTGTNRNISSVITAGSNKSEAPIITKSFDYAKVIDTFQDIAKTSYQTGTYLAFDIVPLAANKYEFQTFINFRGNDRRSSQQNPLVITDINIGDFEFTEDYSTVATAVYARGQGEQVVEVVDTSRERSNIGRREILVSANSSGSNASILTEALAALKNYRSRLVISANFLPSPEMEFERNFNFGDFVTIQLEKQSYDVRISSFVISIDENGKELLQILFRTDG